MATKTKDKTKGILLLAFGRKGYAYAAYNISLSIKIHSPDVHITLYTDENVASYVENFNFCDEVKFLSEDEYKTDGKIDPAKIKTDLYSYLPYDETLYLDVDGVVLKDIQPLITDLSKEKGHILTDVLGKGKRGEKFNYDIWATHEDMWKFFSLDEDSILPTTQSSYMYIKKCKKSEEVFKKAKSYFKKGFDKRKLLENWGGTIPDELIFNGTFAKLGYIPETEIKPIFFGFNKGPVLSPTEIEERYYILSIYGNGSGRTLTRPRYLELYDKIMMKNNKLAGQHHKYKRSHIMNDKHLNFWR